MRLRFGSIEAASIWGDFDVFAYACGLFPSRRQVFWWACDVSAYACGLNPWLPELSACVMHVACACVVVELCSRSVHA